MKASVFDTYVRKENNSLMHFDIVVPEDTPFAQVQAFGKTYLESKKQGHLSLTSKECRFCHIEEANPVLENELINKGHAIIELQNC